MSWPRDGHIRAEMTAAAEIDIRWGFLAAASKKGKFIPATDWSILGKFEKMRAWGEMAGVTGKGLRVTPAIQLALSPKSEWMVVPSSTTFDGDGVFEPGDYVGLPTLSKGNDTVYVRVGMVVESKKGDLVQGAATAIVELS